MLTCLELQIHVDVNAGEYLKLEGDGTIRYTNLPWNHH